MTLDEVLSQMKNRTNLGINRYGTTLVHESTMRAWTATLESFKNTTLNNDYEKCSKCGCQIEIPVCGKCSFPTYDNTAKKHFA